MGTSVISNSTQKSDENCLKKKTFKIKFKMSIDAEAAKKICAVYDWDGKGELDMFYFMDIFYALGMNLTKKTTVKYGQTDDVEKKFMKFDDVVALMQQAVKEPEHTGNYHDYVELCRLYDKNEIPKEDVAKLLDELCDKEDDDGYIPYVPFLERL